MKDIKMTLLSLGFSCVPVTVFSLLCGCAHPRSKAVAQALPPSHPIIGVWTSEPYESGFGFLKREYLFRPDGQFENRGVFVNENSAFVVYGSYGIVEDGRLAMEDEEGKTGTYKFWFDDGALLMQDENSYDSVRLRPARSFTPVLRKARLRRQSADNERGPGRGRQRGVPQRAGVE